jgi:hypothetical protein
MSKIIPLVFEYAEELGEWWPVRQAWVANNWNKLEAAAAPNPFRPTSTWGGGSGFTVIYGVASPVKPPRMGKVQRY